MKTVYKFKPHKHWNYTTEEAYKVLVFFYGPDMLKVEYEEDENAVS
jgi:hypothetical protein